MPARSPTLPAGGIVGRIDQSEQSNLLWDKLESRKLLYNQRTFEHRTPDRVQRVNYHRESRHTSSSTSLENDRGIADCSVRLLDDALNDRTFLRRRHYLPSHVNDDGLFHTFGEIISPIQHLLRYII